MKDILMQFVTLFLCLFIFGFMLITLIQNKNIKYKIDNIDSINNSNQIIIKDLKSNLNNMKLTFELYQHKLNLIDSNVNLIDKNRNIKINNFNIQKDSLTNLIDKLKDETIIDIPFIPILN
jgi:predicted PurR-regulated permease PerM